MSVSIVIISHHDIGNALVKAVKSTFGKEDLPLLTHIIDVLPDTDPDLMIPQLKQLTENLNKGDGVLILTDLFGSTPSNIAQEIQNDHIRIVTGLNLPMLLHVMNDTQLTLNQLVENAITGGQAGIIKCKKEK